MKLEIKSGSENYAATIVEIKEIYPIKDADNIVRTVIFGNDVVVSKDVKTGDKFVYFVSGTKLNHEYCKYNNLYSTAELNNDITQTGYINSKCRVKAVKLRGVVSDGLLLPVNSLITVYNRIEIIAKSDTNQHLIFNYGADIKEINFNLGDTFTTINGVDICEKYIVQSSKSDGANKGVKTPKVRLANLLVQNQLRFHKDTAHFARNLHKFEANDNIVITRKYHGSSSIVSNVLVKRNLNWFERLLLKFGVNIPTEEYGFIWSSGKPKSETPKGLESKTNTWATKNQSFYSEDIWKKAYTKLKDKVEKGITIYSELVGVGIQGVDYTYDFGHEIFVYRITSTNVDGQVIEFTWDQVKKYCEKYDIKYCKEYYNGIIGYYNAKSFDTRDFDLNEKLKDFTNYYLNKSYPDCKNDEGVCIRNERTNEIFKLKSPNFTLYEDKQLEAEISNIEDEY